MIMELMVIVIIILIILIIVLINIIINLNSNIKSITRKIDFINTNETNTLICLRSDNKNLKVLTNEINKNIQCLNKLRIKITEDENNITSTITNLSHDLRTPITSIFGYSKLLSNESLSEKQKGYLKIIEERIKTMRDIVDELYEYSLAYEERELEIEYIDIKPVLEECLLSFYNDFMDKNIDVKIDLGKDKIKRYVDVKEIKRVFVNIIGNALKYGFEFFHVQFLDAQFIFTNEVRDIDIIDVEHIFDRFFTVAKSRTNCSTGLGLSISRKIIEKMNGKINANLIDNMLSIIIKL